MDEITIRNFATAFYAIEMSVYNWFITLYDKVKKWH